MECCHNNGIGSDNRLVNLRWDTRESNMNDKLLHGTTHPTHGSHHGNAKLCDDQVVSMRQESALGINDKALAIKYNCAESYVRSVINGTKWKHLPGAYKRKPGPKCSIKSA